MNKFPYILIIFLSFCGRIFCQEINFSDTIYIIDEVNIFAQKDNENTGVKIFKLDSLIIQKHIHEDLSQLLSQSSTIFVKTQGRGALSTASFRGTSASHTKVSWNNIILNSPLLGMIDLSQIPVSISNSVEIYHGPASIMRNKNALGGLIELNSKCDWKSGLRFSVINSLGSFSTLDNAGIIKIGNQKFQSVSKIYRNSSKNDYPFNNTDIYNGGTERRKNADYMKQGFEQEFYFRTKSNNNLSAKFWYQNSNRGIPGLSTNQSSINSNINRQNGELLNYNIEFTKYSDNIKFELSHGGSYQDFFYNSVNYINGIGYLKILDSHTKSFSIFNYALLKHKISKKFEYITKLNFNNHKVYSYENIRELGYDTSRNESALVLSLFYTLSPKIKFSATLRQEIYNNKLSKPIPLLASEYFIDKKTSLKVAIYQNYNMPSLNDLYYIPGGNPLLKPELSRGTDFGFNHIIQLQNKLSLKLELNCNYNKISDWIMWKPSAMGYWTATNIEEVTAYGLDFNSKITYAEKYFNFYTTINYAFTRSYNSSSQALNENDNSIGKQLAYIPKHSGNIFTNISYKNFYLSYQWTYYSRRYTGSAEEPGILVSIYPYFMNDIYLGKKFLLKNYEIDFSIKIYNLFNESYRSVLWQPMPGRNYCLNLTINFK